MHSFLACDSSASSNYYFNCGNQRVIVTLALAPMSLADVHRVHPALHIYLGNLKAMYSFFTFLPMTRIFGSNLKFLIVHLTLPKFLNNVPWDSSFSSIHTWETVFFVSLSLSSMMMIIQYREKKHAFLFI